MIDRRLRRQLDKAGRRLNTLRTLRGAIIFWVTLAVAAAVYWAAASTGETGITLTRGMVTAMIPAAILLALTIAFVSPYLWMLNYRMVARAVEARFPELQTCLLAALEAESVGPLARRSYLQDQVVTRALAHGYRHGWEQVATRSRLFGWHIGHMVAVGLFIFAISVAPTVQPKRADGHSPGQEVVAQDGPQFQVTVEPGDTEVERGTSLLVMARFRGPIPKNVTLHFARQSPSAPVNDLSQNSGAAKGEAVSTSSDAEKSATGSIQMSKALDDPLFGGSIFGVTEPLTYHVEFAGQKTETYQVGVFEFPRLVKADATLIFPTYTSLGEKLIQDARRASAVAGTRIRLRCELNKPVSDAKLVEKDGKTTELTPLEGSPNVYTAEFVLERTMRCELKLVDAQQRGNKETADFVFTALPNNPPDLRLASPGRDVDASPLEELDLKANAFDDFGLERVGVTYSMAGQEEKELVLGTRLPGKQRLEFTQLVSLEQLQAEPDQLLSYYFWAEDIAPNGEVRHVASDMLFAEVRPFEEIFRQGQQPGSGEQMPGQGAGQSPNANEAEDLAQLQKEIMNATWKLVRREVATRPSEAFASDATLIHESQNTALERATELSQKVEDPQSLRHVQNVLKHMESALKHLAEAKDGPATTALRPALEREQAAYQALLKLRAREHQVVMGQQQRGARGSRSSRAQQQLDQLELKDRQNRYEQERTAAAQEEDPAEREMRQVHSRLRELAQRQNDLNDRLRELQAALQESKDESKREEIRQQLKRLQEEQERILRDTEELQSRMEQPQNAERMAEAQQQLDNARDNVRQSSESLREGQVAQALSTGTRAKDEFEKLRDDFRKQTSAHFQQTVRELEKEATRVDEKEKELAQDLQRLTEPKERPTSLRESGDRDRIASDLEQQKTDVDQLLNRMRQTIEEAEQPQPLLAEKLYDAARQAQQRDLGNGLEMTRRMVERGFDEQSRRQEEPVGQGISELREGISRAADTVLENEAETLRRAQRELQELNNQLREEMRRQGLIEEPANTAGEQNSQDSPSSQPGNDGPSREESNPSDGSPQQPGDGQPKGREGQPNQSGRQPAGKGQPQSGDGPPQNSEGQQPSSDAQQSGNESQNQQGNRQKGGGKRSQKSNGSPQKTGNGQSPGDGQQPANDGQPQAGNGQQSSPQQGSGGQPSGDNQTPSDQGQPSEGQPGRRQPGDRSGQPLRNGSPRDRGGFDQLGGFLTGGGGNERMMEPMNGDDFRQWSDRLRDVEEVLSDPELSAEAARIREQARAIRAEAKRHSAPPNWDLVKMQVAEPLVELMNRVNQELLRQSGKDVLVPIDRDPVPPEFAEEVRKYFERLGAGK